MKIKSARVKNYKSFRDTGDMEFSDGFNVIVGQNNSGKTAILETLGLSLANIPHRSTLTLPNGQSRPQESSTVEISFEISREELLNFLYSIENLSFSILAPNGQQVEPNSFLRTMLLQDKISLHYISTGDIGPKPKDVTLHYPYQTGFSFGDSSSFITFNIARGDGEMTYSSTGYGNRHSPEFSRQILGSIINRIYIFKAERLNVGTSPFGNSGQLKRDASNLPEALNHLASNNPNRYNRLVKYICDIFPSITDVRVRPNPQGGGFEIVTWTEDPNLERSDLAIPLSASGTGVGQVLAILYVVLTSDSPQVIIIDEPNNFLHPGASIKLLEVMKANQKHQYIITTHSPEVIRVTEPKFVHLVKWRRPESIIETLETQDIKNLKNTLVEVGARLSDVFGADNILWVEGQTEEEGFKRILAHSRSDLITGVTIAAVIHTGDFERKSRVELITEIYSKLSNSNGLLPLPIAFIFDREDRSDHELDQLRRLSRDKIHFIGRKQYENYLLDIEALLNVINNLESFSSTPLERDDIEKWIEDNGGKSKFIRDYSETASVENPEWVSKVDAAKLLSSMFKDLSDNKEEYRKTTHSIQLTDWLLDNKPESLADLRELILVILNNKSNL